MATQTKTNDEEIIILEDTPEDNSSNLTIEGDATSLDESIIDLNDLSENKGSEEKKEDNSLDFLFDTKEETKNSEDFDLSLDLGGVEEVKEEGSKDDLGDFSFGTPSTDIASVGTLDSILDETISKLDARQQVIAKAIEEKDALIKEIEVKIADLKADKKESEDAKSGLTQENEKIEANKKELEKMKLAA
ncbi:MAG: hypothetical protein PHH06_05260 [Candidatus Gracilibacteria bacterium]|nr:hypothetical protein [Candidatus Gracilibacteria bacterium]